MSRMQTFVFQSGLLPSRRVSQEGLSLEIKNVKREDAGVYVCTASNGVGKPASAEINVRVECEYAFRFPIYNSSNFSARAPRFVGPRYEY